MAGAWNRVILEVLSISGYSVIVWIRFVMPCNKVFAVLQTTGEKDLKIVSRCNCKVRLYKKTWKKWNSCQRNHTYCCLSADRDSLFFGHLVSDLLWLSRTLKSISTSLQQVILMFAAVWLWTAKVWTSHVVRVHRTLSKGIWGVCWPLL